MVGGLEWSSSPPQRYDNLQLHRTELSVFGRGARFLHLPRALLFLSLVISIARAIRRRAPERVICVYPDAYYCAAVYCVSRWFKIPVAYYFHNTYAENRSGIWKIWACRLEAKLLSNAAWCYFISQGLRQAFVERYPAIASKSSVLCHPVGEAAVPSAPRGFRREPVKAVMMGTFNESNLDAACRLVKALSAQPHLQIHVATRTSPQVLEQRGMDLAGVRFHGYLDDQRLQELLADADLFLLPHGLNGGYSQREYQTIFPTRAAYYLSYGRPVLAHAPEDSALVQFLRSNDCAAVVADASEDAIRAAFRELYEKPEWQYQLAGNAKRAASLFDPSRFVSSVLNDPWSAA